jgi:hypothetical protein
MIQIVDIQGKILGLLDTTVHPLPSAEHGRHVRVGREPRKVEATASPTDSERMLELRWHCVKIKDAGVSSATLWYLVAPNGVFEEAWETVGLIDLQNEWKR